MAGACSRTKPLISKKGTNLKKLEIDLPYNLAIPLLGIYLKECDSGYNKGTCTPMFIAALSTIAKLWKQPRSPTTDEWIKKTWYLYTMEFYSATKNEMLSFASKWMELENITSSKVSQFQKPKIACSPSYVDCRPKTNVAILWDMGHTKERLCMGRIGQGKETKNLIVVDMLKVQE
jgi:hypothetical protein